jgi:hypothetical protein
VRKGKQSHLARIRAEKQSQDMASSLHALDLTFPAVYFRPPSLDQMRFSKPCEAVRGRQIVSPRTLPLEGCRRDPQVKR